LYVYICDHSGIGVYKYVYEYDYVNMCD